MAIETKEVTSPSFINEQPSCTSFGQVCTFIFQKNVRIIMFLHVINVLYQLYVHVHSIYRIHTVYSFCVVTTVKPL